MNSHTLVIEKQGLNSMLEEVFDLMTDGIITTSKCKAVMSNIIDSDKDEAETELEVFVGGWLSKVDSFHCRKDD